MPKKITNKWSNEFLSNSKNSNCHNSLWFWIHFEVYKALTWPCYFSLV